MSQKVSRDLEHFQILTNLEAFASRAKLLEFALYFSVVPTLFIVIFCIKGSDTKITYGPAQEER